MEGWIVLWKAVLTLGVLAFAVLSVWIAVAGWSDVLALFVRLKHGSRGRGSHR